MPTILETYPDHTPASLRVGDDNFVHFANVFGESWCASSYTDYFVVELNESLELFEKIDDDKISEFCPGCKEAADGEE